MSRQLPWVVAEQVQLILGKAFCAQDSVRRSGFCSSLTFQILEGLAAFAAKDALFHTAITACLFSTVSTFLVQIEGVVEVHDLHIWSLKPGMPLLAAHINVGSNTDSAEVLHDVTSVLRSAGIKHTTIQMVTDEDGCPCVSTPERVRSRRYLLAAEDGSEEGGHDHEADDNRYAGHSHAHGNGHDHGHSHGPSKHQH